MGFDAVVLAGGRARRLGGVDKAAILVAGRPLLERALDAVAAAETTVVVGPRRNLGRSVTWAREEPAGSGPAAAIEAGLPFVHAPVVVVLAVDVPLVDGSVVARLADIPEGCDGAILVDPSGRDQPLAGAYRRGPLAGELARLRPSKGAPMRALVSGMRLARIVSGAARDCDTWDDVAAVRRLLGGDDAMERWVTALSAELDVDTLVDVDALLDAARVAAHKVERRAAPLTTFLMGVAIARGADPQVVARRVIALARGWDGHADGPTTDVDVPG
jgi:molybdopterin-guanine dinucleotide biosynthesis protein A